MRRALWVLLLAAGCSNDNGYAGPPGGDLPAPTNLSYTVTPGGPAAAPTATLLQWDLPTSSAVVIWNVYSRTSTSAAFGLRGTTTSTSFHDRGGPELEYYVTALDEGGLESPGSNIAAWDVRRGTNGATSRTMRWIRSAAFACVTTLPTRNSRNSSFNVGARKLR